MILTHCGKLGDFLYSLPIAEWFHKVRGHKVHWVLPRCFLPFQKIESLLRLQPHCENVTLVDFKVRDWDHGGQPYKFNPADYGIEGDYFNLGFRSYPNCFIPAFYAAEYQLGFVEGYRMKIWESDEQPFPTGEVLRSNESGLDRHVNGAVRLPDFDDLLFVAQRISKAREFHTWYCGLAVLAYMAGIPQHVYRQRGHADNRMYFPDATNITWHNI